MSGIDVRNHLEMIQSLLDRHNFPQDKFIIDPRLERSGLSSEGRIVIREEIGEEEGLPLSLTDDHRELLLRDHGMRIACLILHEMYHCRNHFIPISQLSIEERMANDIEADEWALRQIGLIE